MLFVFLKLDPLLYILMFLIELLVNASRRTLLAVIYANLTEKENFFAAIGAISRTIRFRLCLISSVESLW